MLHCTIDLDAEHKIAIKEDGNFGCCAAEKPFKRSIRMHDAPQQSAAGLRVNGRGDCF